MQAGFIEFDITPALGTKKGGWMEDLTAEVVLDALYGRAAVFATRAERIAFIQLDLLSIRWTHVNDIRRRVENTYNFPGRNVMVACTHNHAGPATSRLDPVEREDAYNETLTQRCIEAFGKALEGMRNARVGFNSAFELEVGFNRRTIFRDGTVKTQRGYDTPGALCCEGPIDPEVAVLAVQDLSGHLMGCLVSFACHPTHHGGTNEISAGFPGALAAKMKEQGCPVTLFLNGPYGNITTTQYLAPKAAHVAMEEAGTRLFDDVCRALANMDYESEPRLGAALSTVEVQYRNVTDDEYRGRVNGAQRFRSDELYERSIDRLLEQVRAGKRPKADVQVLRVGDWYFAGIPGEYFVEHGLRIKLDSYPKYALVVGGANGMLGYLPTVQAFKYGGYETTLGPPSRMAPETGDILADEAIRLIAEL